MKMDTLLSAGFKLIAIAILTLSLAGYLGRLNLFLELTSHFKPQYLILSGLILIVFVVLKNPTWIWVSALCVGVNLVAIVPWYLPPVQPSMSVSVPLRVLSANINIRNRNYDAVRSLIRSERPDLFVLIEVNRGWLNAMDELKAEYPYSLKSPNADRFGIALYSAFPLKNAVVQEFQAADVPAIATTVIKDGQPITAIAIHPPPPISTKLFNLRNRDLQIVSDYVRHITKPVVLVGDFNASIWSPFFQQFAQRSQLKNTRRGFGILPTWSTDMPVFYTPIDHCFVSSGIQVRNSKTVASIGSDHLPIVADLNIGIQP